VTHCLPVKLSPPAAVEVVADDQVATTTNERPNFNRAWVDGHSCHIVDCLNQNGTTSPNNWDANQIPFRILELEQLSSLCPQGIRTHHSPRGKVSGRR
jgi:hypothetical protein